MLNDVVNNVAASGHLYIIMVKYVCAALIMGIGSIGVSMAQGKIAGKACDALAQNPSVEKGIRSTFFVGMIFVETSAIYCLVISLMLLFI